MAKEIRPPWQIELLWYESWTHHQFLSALCGEDPDVAVTLPDEWTAEQQRAERHVDAAIRAGELFVEFTRAATLDEPYGDYNVPRDVAIRWATKSPGRFPLFPFTVDDLPSRGTLEVPDTQLQDTIRELSAPAVQHPAPVGAEPVIEAQADLKDRRAKLLADYKRATGVTKNKPIYENRRSGIHKPQFYEWRNGTLPATTQTAINFERFLAEKRRPRAPD